MDRLDGPWYAGSNAHTSVSGDGPSLHYSTLRLSLPPPPSIRSLVARAFESTSRHQSLSLHLCRPRALAKMSERKVLNKYYPPDFDPSKIPRRKMPKDKQELIRLMAPFSMRCKACGEYIYAGKKFNGRKETVQGQEYYGIKIFRFYIKCPMCSSEITFKTDPKNADYTVEHGVTRNFEPWREGKGEDEAADPLAHIMAEEGLEGSDDEEDPMKALEKRQADAQREMEVMDALQDIRTRNARLARVDTADVISRLEEKGKSKLSAEEEEQRRLEEEDEVLVRKYFGRDLAAGGDSADASASPASHSPQTPTDGADTRPGAAGSAVKRPRPDTDDVDNDDDSGYRTSSAHADSSGSAKHAIRRGGEAHGDKEPDVRSLLSERAREQLLSTATATATGVPIGAKTSTQPASGTKRKKQTSAFGIVRKKA